MTHMKTVKVTSIISHRPPGVVSFCFDDHVHNNHLVCSDCHTQSRLTLLLRIQHVQQNTQTFFENIKYMMITFLLFFFFFFSSFLP